jgi:tetratricopeptide (TPR) repeat protein
MDHPGERVGSAAYGPDGKFIQTYSTRGATRTVWVWAAPPETERGRTPAWVLDLATICAGRRVTDDGRIVGAETAWARMGEIRRIVAELPEDDRLAEWGRWLLSDSPQRPIAPGFTVTPAEAEALRASMGAKAEAIASVATEDAALSARIEQLIDEEKWPEAEIAARQALERFTPRGDSGSRAIGPTFQLAIALWRQGKFDEAEPFARTAVRILEKVAPSGSFLAMHRGLLGAILFGQRRFSDAEPLLVTAYASLKNQPEFAIYLRPGAEELVKLYTATNNPAKVAEWQKIVAGLPPADPTARDPLRVLRRTAPVAPKAGQKKAP